MTIFARTGPDFEPVDIDGGAEAARLHAQDMSPLLAGARARGMADAYEMLELPAIFLDSEGEVLYVGQSALKLFGKHLAVHARQLIGATPLANARVQGLVDAALSVRPAPDSANLAIIERGEGLPPLKIHAVPVPGAQDDPCQLLKAILILDASEPGDMPGFAVLARQIAAIGRRGN